MPIYEYQCEKCGCRFEELQEMNAAAPACPKCKGKVKKLMSAATPLSSTRGSSGQGCCKDESRCGGGACPGAGKCGI